MNDIDSDGTADSVLDRALLRALAAILGTPDPPNQAALIDPPDESV